ncbi:plasmid replication DNA-binding protein KfrA [Paraburkholderia sp. BL27I4N3]|uniref:DNA-binding protein n=1 Tax=Paraburkholderia sp. BL27I4N3 TaxID=1938805 RepID=UPI000E27FF6C|nr:DNA-binding protein [Paraburkholderia sp. BL27I4N3]REE06586.1 plasmid replication DNA-binding protein KfrA [Paraburkholderia sp. BL27I4N3]
MAREPNITQEQVSKAAESIRGAGGRPTARAIRERLGTGSMATVLRFFQAWQDAQVKPAEPPAALPQALQRGLLDFVAAEVDRSRIELRTELDIANQANADLIIESERQGLMVENLTASLEKVHAERAELSGRLGQVEAERDASRQEAAAERRAAESARTDLAKALLRLEAMPRLEKDLHDARRELDSERVARVNAEQSAAVAVAKLEASLEARQSIERTLGEARRHEQEKDAELASVRADLKDARSAADALRAELLGTVKPRSAGPPTATRTRKKPE